MNWLGKKVLVTGAGGFIGSHLSERLVEYGANVKALIHYNSKGSYGWLDQSALLQNIEIITGDIRDNDTVKSALNDVEIVFHLAALISIPYSYQAPLSYIKTNIEGTFNILQQTRQCNVKRVVHTSTSEVYGTAKYVPIDETHPLQGQSPYSASKIGADKMVEAYHASFDVPVVTVRPFNAFGPRQSTRAVIMTIITQCLKGGDIKLGHLHPTRDFNYVSNIVDGFLLSAMCDKAIGKTINLGSNREISIKDLALMIADIIGCQINIQSDEHRLRPLESEVDRLKADASLADKLLGWKPNVSLEEGLKKTIEWTRQHIHEYRPKVYHF